MASNQRQKVRVIAKIRGYSDLELESGAADLKPWISVRKPAGEGDEFQTVALSFGDQSTSRKECYEVNSCYERDQGNAIIFEKEVKSLVSEVISGRSATIIAYGARGSGKTHLIQGSEDEWGLAILAIAEILSAVRENENSVTVSMYEIDNEHAYDLLDQKRPEVLVLDNSQGMVQLKGLSQVPVKSMSEIQKLYISKQEKHRQSKKIPSSALYRNHRGLMIHIYGKETSDTPLGKMNFVALAAYEDARRKSIDSHSLGKINKSIYALQNVVYALNANESHVPYRESRLTRMLQDSLRGTNRILMVACLNPSFCQDSATVASLASRVVRAVNKSVPDSAKKSKSLTRPLPSSDKSRMLGSASTSVRKQISLREPSSEKKTNQALVKIKARKLFNEACQSTKLQKSTQKVSVQESSVLDTVQANLVVATPCDDDTENVMPSLNSNAALPSELQMSPKRAPSPLSLKPTLVTNSSEKVNLPFGEEQTLKSTTEVLPISEEGAIDRENNSPLVSENGIACISERMQELSNNLKLLCASIPSYVKTPPKTDSMGIPCIAADIPLAKTDNFSSGAKISADISEPRSGIDNKCIPHDASDILVPRVDLSSCDTFTNISEIQQETDNLCITHDDDATDIPGLKNESSSSDTISADILEPKTPDRTPCDRDFIASSDPWHTLSVRSAGMKNSLVEEYLKFLNTADKAELKRLKGIGEKRATCILELRDESPEPFKSLDDLQEIGLSAKQIKTMMRKQIDGLFS